MDARVLVERREPELWRGAFQAMASPCEVWVPTSREDDARRMSGIAAAEAWRIETKFSRYRDDNIVHAINASRGTPFCVDDETAQLIDFAERLWRLSDGAFDITSGALRRVWHFDGSDGIPTPGAVDAILPFVGWHRLVWRSPEITLPQGMEVDFGGIGKEYAVDRVANILRVEASADVLVNFGGDLVATGARADGSGWSVSIEKAGADQVAARTLSLRSGGLATSGDARRFLEKDGVRYSHVLDPRTGWPVPAAPRSVTVLAGTCTEAGSLAKLGLLHGTGAETFLREQGVQYWCQLC